MKKIALFLFLTFTFFPLCSCMSSQWEPIIFLCSNKLENPYGIISHLTKENADYPYLAKEVAIMKRIGINSVRLDFAASQIKKDSNGWHTKIWDTVIDTLKASDIELLPILDRTIAAKPAWVNVSGYHKYLKYTLEKYGKDASTWELMNEADLYPVSITYDSSGKRKKTFDYSASGAGYMSKLPDFYKYIKSISPSTKVLISGLASDKNGFLDTICVHGGYKYFDIMNIHCYLEPEQIPVVLKRIKRKMDKYGWAKPIWITECGMHTAKNGEKWRTEEEQASRLPRIFLLSFAYGVDRVYWYNLRSRENDISYKEDHFGIMHADLSPKPAYYTYKTLVSLCPNGSTRPRVEQYNDLYRVNWVRPDGKCITAVWSKKKRKISMQTKGNVRYLNSYGKRIAKVQYASKDIIYIIGKVDFIM